MNTIGIIGFILLVFAFVLFALSAVGVGHPRVNLIAAGLASWVLAALLGAWPGS